MRTELGLLEPFVIAIVLAFVVTFTTGTLEMRILSAVVITPIIILSLIFTR
jgi:hypothetical protein